MNFAFANFIDRRQQGIDIALTSRFAVSLYSFAVFIIFPATVTLLLPPVVKSAWHLLSMTVEKISTRARLALPEKRNCLHWHKATGGKR